jgi:RNA polymerase sigma factor (sigma-70 family)
VAAWSATEPFRFLRAARLASRAAVADTLEDAASDRDAELVELARRGDQQAYGVLVARHQQIAFRAAYVIVRDADDAADAAQQGFIKAYHALGRFRRGAPFRPWLLRIVTNEARNARRTAGARGRLAMRLGQAWESDPTPEDAALRAERRDLVLGALERAPEEDRLVVGLRFFLQLGEAEMATTLDCPPGTVKSRLSRALGRLRADLEAQASTMGASAEASAGSLAGSGESTGAERRP